MLDCIVVGDSIGLGVSQLVRECDRDVQISRTIAMQLSRPTPINTVVVISIGSNDVGLAADTITEQLQQLRDKYMGSIVVWVKPRNNEAARIAIDTLANRYHDGIVDSKKFFSADGVHPYSYAALAADVRTVKNSK